MASHPADVAPQHPRQNAQKGLHPGHHKADEQAGAGARPDAGPQVLADGVGAEPELAVGLLVAQGQAVEGVVIDEVGVPLAGQVGLHHGEEEQGGHDQEEKDRHPVFEEGSEGALPIGVVGVAALLGLPEVVPGGSEEGALLLRGEGPLHLLQERLFLVGTIARHQRAPSFLLSLMRGSATVMRRSPRMRPMMPTVA